MNLDRVKIIELPKILDERGNLSFLEENNHIPFKIRRTYWIYDVPGGEKRGGHSYHENEEIIIALSGSFDIVLNDSVNSSSVSLNRSYYGVFIPKGIWRHMENFSTNAVALIISSTDYNEDDYVRNYETYKSYKKNG